MAKKTKTKAEANDNGLNVQVGTLPGLPTNLPPAQRTRLLLGLLPSANDEAVLQAVVALKQAHHRQAVAIRGLTSALGALQS